MQRESKVTQMGADNHGKFSRVTGRDAKGEIAWRQRLDHGDRRKLREQLKTWPTRVRRRRRLASLCVGPADPTYAIFPRSRKFI